MQNKHDGVAAIRLAPATDVECWASGLTAAYLEGAVERAGAPLRRGGFPDEHWMQSRITELDPPRRLAFAWNRTGDVSIELEPKGDEVLLTLIHPRLPDRATLLRVGAGWHMHLDLLVARTIGREPEPFWDGWVRLQKEYDRRMPA